MLAQKRSVRDTLVKNAKTLQMVGKQLTLRINGKKVVGHLAHTGDEPT